VSNWPLLSVLIWLPILGGALILAIRDAQTARWASLGVAVLTFVASLAAERLQRGIDGMQFVETHAWIPAYKIGYNLGVDGIAVALILLTTWSACLPDRRLERHRQARQPVRGGLPDPGRRHRRHLRRDGRDAVLRVLRSDADPDVPDHRCLGRPAPHLRALKFFLYTFLGSVLMLVALIYLYMKGGSFQLADLYALPLSAKEQTWMFFAFLIAFAVKVPMFPVHTWLPDAHVEAPTAGSVILAAIALKIGGYGFLRFNLPIVPDASQEWAWLVIALSLIAVIYVGLVALVQDDMKKLIAYSSIAHMGFVTLGTFIALWLVREAGNADAARLGLQGAMVQMISHGFVSGAMFSCIGVLYDRMHSRRSPITAAWST
jgi:NADH-quinone oxidoreductase subunit M